MQNIAERGVAAEPTASTHAASIAPDAGLSLSAALRSVYRDANALLHDHLRLAALEAQRAVRNLVAMIAFAIVAALLAVTGWLALAAALVAWAVESGASWSVAFVCAAIISAGVAVGAVLWIRHLSAQLMFALTLRWLRPSEQPPRTERNATQPPPREARV